MIGGKLPIVLVQAAYTRDKARLLAEANRRIEVLRWLVRMAKDRNLVTARQYEFSSEKLAECGKMVGGWSKQAAGRVETRAKDAKDAKEEG
jgi:hypothetical protein